MRAAALIALSLCLAAPAPRLAAQARPPAVAPRPVAQGPFELLLAHREALALTDHQVRSILAIRQRVEARNAPLVARLVGMRRELGPRVAPRAMSHRDRADLRERARAARPILEQIRANNREAMREVGELLTPGQKDAVRRLVEHRRQRGRAPRAGPPGSRGNVR